MAAFVVFRIFLSLIFLSTSFFPNCTTATMMPHNLARSFTRTGTIIVLVRAHEIESNGNRGRSQSRRSRRNDGRILDRKIKGQKDTENNGRFHRLSHFSVPLFFCPAFFRVTVELVTRFEILAVILTSSTMPIVVHAETRRLSQEEFGAMAYDVVRCLFEIHNRFGRLFDEQVYRREVARRCNGLPEVPVEATHSGFQTFLYIDLLVAQGAVFELKAVDSLHDRHRAQLLQYLLMAELSHGKLVNLRPEAVEHEFVNTSLTLADRTVFSIRDDGWDSSFPGSQKLRIAAENLLRDLGTGLDVSLYEEAVMHSLGGEGEVLREIEVFGDGQIIGRQKFKLSGPLTHFRITALDERSRPGYADHLRRFLEHTSLEGIHWINATRREVTFTTLTRTTSEQTNSG